jgi:predicted site-specific integrase-resolvase
MPNTRKIILASEMRHQLGGISVATEHRWRGDGILPSPLKINKRNFYLQIDIDELVQHIAETQEVARHV